MQDGVTPTPSDFTDEEGADNILKQENDIRVLRGDEETEKEESDDISESDEDNNESSDIPQGDKYVIFSFIRHGEVIPFIFSHLSSYL